MLFAQGDIGNKAQFEHPYGPQPLGKFIRSIVEMDIEAAKAAFSEFINAPALNPKQIRFVNIIIQYLTVNGVINAGVLFSAPFTDISSSGLTDVFNPEDSAEIILLVKRVNENAMVV